MKWARYDQKWSSRKIPDILVIFSETGILSTDFRKTLNDQIKWKSVQLSHADKRTDRHDEANIRFCAILQTRLKTRHVTLPNTSSRPTKFYVIHGTAVVVLSVTEGMTKTQRQDRPLDALQLPVISTRNGNQRKRGIFWLGLTYSTAHQKDLQHKERVTARIKPNNLTAWENTWTKLWEKYSLKSVSTYSPIFDAAVRKIDD
jgi:hypothetical protein